LRRADGDRYRFGRFRWRNNVALAVKNSAWLDDQTMRVNLSGRSAFFVNLHFSLCKGYAVEVAGDHNVVAFDLAFHACLVAQNQNVSGNYQALQLTFDAEGSGALEGSFETNGFIEKPGPFGGMFGLSLPKLPGQKSPQKLLRERNCFRAWHASTRLGSLLLQL
jgi:hypothetical protein